MKVGRAARSPPVTADPSLSIRDAARLMAERRIGLLVLTRGDEIFGVVSERDIVRAVAQGLDLGAPVGAIATRSVITIDAEATLAEAARLMREKGVRHLVVTKGGRLYGVLSIRDVVDEMAHLEMAAEGAINVEHTAPAD